MDRLMGNAKFGVSVLRAKDDSDVLSSNGLPVACNAVQALGRFQDMKSLNHDNLCKYIELVRCSITKPYLLLFSEHYEYNLADVIREQTETMPMEIIWHVASQVADALQYLHHRGIQHGSLTPSYVLIADSCKCIDGKTQDFHIRLTNYGITHLDLIKEGTFPVDDEESYPSSIGLDFEMDISSLGFIIMEMYTGQCLKKLLVHSSFAEDNTKFGNDDDGSVLEYMLQGCNLRNGGAIREKDPMIEKLAFDCANNDETEQLTIDDVIERLDSMQIKQKAVELLGLVRATLPTIIPVDGKAENFFKYSDLYMDEAFYVWRLSGATPENIAMKMGILREVPPFMTFPTTALRELHKKTEVCKDYGYHVRGIIAFPDNNVREKILNVPKTEFSFLAHGATLFCPDVGTKELELSVMVKENDIAYQVQRMYVVRRALSAPKEIAKAFFHCPPLDIPPVYRAQVWCLLLDVSSSKKSHTAEIDTLAEHTSDRQLEVDIPRCHQYDELMTTQAAHEKMKKLLKGYLDRVKETESVYWQGSDSLAAPFLLLNLNSPDMALGCYMEFIHRYLNGFYFKDNSAIVKEYLAVFNLLLSYVDARLFSHFKALDFVPDMYAISWFLTCFAHVLPKQKLFHLWDTLLLQDTSFPLFVGLAILDELRSSILDLPFNDVIIKFSDLQEIHVARVLSTAHRYKKIVPPSCTFRVYDSPWQVERNKNEPTPYCLKRDLTPLKAMELEKLPCCRLSAMEFVWRVHEKCILAIDIRAPNDYSRGCVSGSVNFPSADMQDIKVIEYALGEAKRAQHPICIVWTNWNLAEKFASSLVSAGVNGICLLDGGFQSIRDKCDILQVAR